MSSRRSETALHLELRASRRLAMVMAVPYALALAALPLIDIPVWLTLLIAFLVLAAAREALRRHAWLVAPEAVTSATWLPSGNWAVSLAGGTRLGARIVGVPFVLPALVIVRLRLETGRQVALILIPGMVPEDELRRLRIRLRHLAGEGAGSPGRPVDSG